MSEGHRISVMIAVESPFGSYDMERYQLAELSQLVDLHVLDLTPLIHRKYWKVFGSRAIPHEVIDVVWSTSELNRIADCASWDAWIDELGQSGAARRLRRTLHRRGLIRVWLRLGLLPGDFAIQSDARHRFQVRLSQRGWWRTALSIPVALMRRLTQRAMHPDVVIGSGSFTEREVGSHCPIIWAHSFDYEKAIRVQPGNSSSSTRRVVFLDQSLGHHPDQLHSGLLAPVVREDYLQSMRELFSRLESTLGVVVEVALHPKSNSAGASSEFGGRRVVEGGAHLTMLGANLVVSHASASISFAAIWRLPLLFVTSDEIEKSWYRPHIREMSRILRRPVLNIDDLRGISDDRLRELSTMSVDEDAYADYVEKFIRSRWSSESPLWATVASQLAEHTAIRSAS